MSERRCEQCGQPWCDPRTVCTPPRWQDLATQLEQMRRQRDEARAKLARIRSIALNVAWPADDALDVVLRIIDEKEGGQ